MELIVGLSLTTLESWKEGRVIGDLAVVVRSSPIPRSPREAAIIRRSQASSSHSPPPRRPFRRFRPRFSASSAASSISFFPRGSRSVSPPDDENGRLNLGDGVKRCRIATIVPRVSSDRGSLDMDSLNLVVPRFFLDSPNRRPSLLHTTKPRTTISPISSNSDFVE